ncbi:zinc finger protein 1 homolog [Physella acuta]|uniref:zinc finger protein 1 homolog n=1 Tax=Physella acuta TaxID=109671 RepID=UPI0027DB7761|nr:zinc finger protein 1 homolog [Physella acuta]XP_059178033.1 zinc finger protein 1 homolog [Physella acuta]
MKIMELKNRTKRDADIEVLPSVLGIKQELYVDNQPEILNIISSEYIKQEEFTETDDTKVNVLSTCENKNHDLLSEFTTHVDNKPDRLDLFSVFEDIKPDGLNAGLSLSLETTHTDNISHIKTELSTDSSELKDMLISNIENPTSNQVELLKKCKKQNLKSSKHKTLPVLVKWKESHTDVGSYECNVCHKKFATRTYLKQHNKAIHLGERLHECGVCHKNFTTRGNLNLHIAIHSAEKKHECDLCHKNFTTRGNLNVHIAIHSAEKKHECDLCHKNFTTRGNLNVHIAIHSAEKKHECDLCP